MQPEIAGEVRFRHLDGLNEKYALAKWLVTEGDPVAFGQPLAIIETDSLTIEWPVYLKGLVTRRHIPVGQVVPDGTLLATIQVNEDRPVSIEGHPMQFAWTDAVILLAVCRANKRGGSDRESIRKVEDLYARCCLTDLEYFGGMHRLLFAGHVYLDDERIFADEAALEHHASAPECCENVEQYLEHTMSFLDIKWPH